MQISGAEFEVVESELEEPLKTQYSAAARMWSQIRREFLYAIEQASNGKEEEGPKRGSMLWRFFWAAQQRFFRHLCMAAKVSMHSGLLCSDHLYWETYQRLSTSISLHVM